MNRLIKYSLLFTIGIIILVFAAFLLLAGTPSSSDSLPQNPVDYLDFVNDHHFSILVINEQESPCHTMAVYEFVRDRYKGRVLTWGVQEIDGVNYVIAYETGSFSLGRFDPVNRQIADLMANYQEPPVCDVSRADVEQLFPVINR